MDSSSCSLLFFVATLLCLSSTSTAFNITRILANQDSYGAFNQLLSQTGLASQINSRTTITVLAVNDGAMGALSGKSVDVAKRILSAHVILDYYDIPKLQKLTKSVILTTLYQASGTADDKQGFLNVTKTQNGIMFGSAAKGAPLTANLGKTVMTQPYNISVLEISGVIQVPGIDNPSPPTHSPPSPPPKKAPAPGPAVESPADAPAPKSPHGPAPAPGPDSPAPGPEGSEAPEADAAQPPKSAASTIGGVAVVVMMGLVASVMGL